MECVLIDHCPYIVVTQNLIYEEPSFSKRIKLWKKQEDEIEKLSCGEEIGEKVCCAKAKAGT